MSESIPFPSEDLTPLQRHKQAQAAATAAAAALDVRLGESMSITGRLDGIWLQDDAAYRQRLEERSLIGNGFYTAGVYLNAERAAWLHAQLGRIFGLGQDSSV